MLASSPPRPPPLAAAGTAAAPPAAKVQSIPSSIQAHVVTPTRQAAKSILGHDTNVVIQEYLDRTLVIVTQTGKIASITQASIPTTSSPYAPLSSPLGSAPDAGAAATAAASPDHDPFLDDDDGDVHVSGPSRSSSAASPSTTAHASSSATPPTPLAPPNLTQSPLLGTPPPGFATMQSLYVSTIYSLIRPQPVDAMGDDQQQQRDPRPVIVALGLRLSASGTAAAGVVEDGEGNDEVEEMAAREGPRFKAVVELVKECQAQQQHVQPRS